MNRRQVLFVESYHEKLIAGTGDTARLVARFVRMDRPHEAREDTAVFPAFHELLSEKEHDKLGDLLEDREHQLLGAKGFEGQLEKVAEIERQPGIFDLAQFTP